MNEQLIGDLFAEATRRMTGSSSKEFSQKFAELIVKECAKVADIADENKCEWIGGNILTHFGVEE